MSRERNLTGPYLGFEVDIFSRKHKQVDKHAEQQSAPKSRVIIQKNLADTAVLKHDITLSERLH